MLNIIKKSGFEFKTKLNVYMDVGVEIPHKNQRVCPDIQALAFMEEFAATMRKTGAYTVVSEMAKRHYLIEEREMYEKALQCIEICMDPEKLFVQTNLTEWMLVFLMGTASFGVDASPSPTPSPSPVQILTDDLMWAIFEQTRMCLPRIRYTRSRIEDRSPLHDYKTNELQYQYQPETGTCKSEVIVSLKIETRSRGIFDTLTCSIYKKCDYEGKEARYRHQMVKVHFDSDYDSLLPLPLTQIRCHGRESFSDDEHSAIITVQVPPSDFGSLETIHNMTLSAFVDKYYVPYWEVPSRPVASEAEDFVNLVSGYADVKCS